MFNFCTFSSVVPPKDGKKSIYVEGCVNPLFLRFSENSVSLLCGCLFEFFVWFVTCCVVGVSSGPRIQPTACGCTLHVFEVCFAIHPKNNPETQKKSLSNMQRAKSVNMSDVGSMSATSSPSASPTFGGHNAVFGRPSASEIEALTKDVIGNYTQKQIEKLMELQSKFDKFAYVPRDSNGGTLPDNGSDPYYAYQSNLIPILKILQQEGNYDDSDIEDEEARKEREEKMARVEKLHEEGFNNALIHAERNRACELRDLSLQLHETHDNTFFRLLSSFQSAMQEDANDPIQCLGEPEQQIDVLGAIAKLRRDQTNLLKTIAHFLIQRLEEALSHASRMKTASPDQVEQSDVVRSLRTENELLLREQEYLYHRLYGSQHKVDPKAERQKRYRKEVDDTYKQMVDNEVMRKVVAAAKNTDAYMKKVTAQIKDFKKMMTQCHAKTLAIAEYGRRALRTNRALESHVMNEFDLPAQISSLHKAIVSCTGFNVEPKDPNAPVETRREDIPVPHTLPVDVPVVDVTLKGLKAGIATALADAQNQLATKFLSRSPAAGSATTMCQGMSEVADTLDSSALGSFQIVFAVAQSLPPALRAETLPLISRLCVLQSRNVAVKSLNDYVSHIADGVDTHNSTVAVDAELRRVKSSCTVRYITSDAECQTTDIRLTSRNGSANGDASTATPQTGNEDTIVPLGNFPLTEEPAPLATPPANASLRPPMIPPDSLISEQPSRRQSLRTSVVHAATPSSTGLEGSLRSDVPPSEKPSPIASPRDTGGKSPQRGSIASSRKLSRRPTGAQQQPVVQTQPVSAQPSPEQGAMPQTQTPTEGQKVTAKKSDPADSAQSEQPKKRSGAVGVNDGRERRRTTIASESSSKTDKDGDDPFAVPSLPHGRSVTKLKAHQVDEMQMSTDSVATSHRPIKQPLKVTSTKGTSTVEVTFREFGTQATLPAAQQGLLDHGQKTGDQKAADRITSPQSSELGSKSPQSPASTFPAGPCTLVFCGIEGVLTLWDRCSDVMPSFISLYVDILRDGLRQFRGYEARCESDSLLCVFVDPLDALSWCSWVQHHVMRLPYPKSVLAVAAARECRGPDGAVVQRGFRVRMGVHTGSPQIAVTDGKPLYRGMPVTFAARIAMLAAGGQIMLSDATATAARPRIEANTTLAMALRRQGEVLGEAAEEPLWDLACPATAGRTFDSSTSEADPLMRAGALHQWLCTYAVECDFATQRSCCMVFVDTQSPVDFPGTDASIIHAAIMLVTGEISRLLEKHGGVEARQKQASIMYVFESPVAAVQFAIALQLRAMQLPFSDELLAIPECHPEFIDGQLSYRGLQIRVGMHFGTPDSHAVNRFKQSVHFYGPEVQKGSEIAALARFGETILSDSLHKEIAANLSSIGNPILLQLGKKTIGTNEVELYSIIPTALRARAQRFNVSTPFYRRIAAEMAASLKTKAEDDGPIGEIELGDTSFVLACSVDRAEDLLEQCASEFEKAMSLLVSTVREAVARHEGFEASFEGINITVLFQKAQDAIDCGMEIQEKSMKASFPSKILDLCGTVDISPGDPLFRGLRLSMCVHCGRLYEYHLGGVAEKRSFYFPPIQEALFLANSYACGGEILMTQAVVTGIQENVGGPEYLARHVVYRIENLVLPGHMASTALHGLLSERLQLRRKTFFRGEKKSAIRQSFEIDAAGGGAPAVPQRRRAKFGVEASASGHAASPPLDELIIGGGEEQDSNLHRRNAQQVQRLYRRLDKAGRQTSQVMGYPVELDEDPVAFDALLQDAIVSEADESVLFEQEWTILQRVDAIVRDMQLALNCKTAKGTYMHRSQQSVIVIPPSEKKDDVLYADVDTGASKTAPSLATGFVSGFRPGIGSGAASSKLKERRIMELEAELGGARQQLQVYSEQSNQSRCPCSTAAACQTEFEGALVVQSMAVVSPTSYVHPAPGEVPFSQPCARVWRHHSLLAPLQTPYERDNNIGTVVMQGEASSDAALQAPFSKKSVPVPGRKSMSAIDCVVDSAGSLHCTRPHSTTPSRYVPGTAPFYLSRQRGIAYSREGTRRRKVGTAQANCGGEPCDDPFPLPANRDPEIE